LSATVYFVISHTSKHSITSPSPQNLSYPQSLSNLTTVSKMTTPIQQPESSSNHPPPNAEETQPPPTSVNTVFTHIPIAKQQPPGSPIPRQTLEALFTLNQPPQATIYVDDIVVHTLTAVEHWVVLDDLIELLEGMGVKLDEKRVPGTFVESALLLEGGGQMGGQSERRESRGKFTGYGDGEKMGLTVYRVWSNG
jgi:hypothetical protein